MTRAPTIAPCSQAQYEQVDLVIRQAFGGDDEVALVRGLRADGDLQLELVAMINGRVVGHVAFSYMQAPFRSLALAPLTVSPDYQGQGLGTALCEAGIEQCKNAAWEAIFVLGHLAYYQRFGFSVNEARGYESPYAGDYFMMCQLTDGLPRQGEITHALAFSKVD